MKNIVFSQQRQFGLLLVLVASGLAYVLDLSVWLTTLFGCLIQLLVVIAPPLFNTPLKLRLACADLFGRVANPIIISVIYFGMLTPISLILRVFGRDVLRLKSFKKRDSTWIYRSSDEIGKLSEKEY